MAIGAGVTGAIDGGVIAAALLGLVVACALWWAYFDVAALLSEERFREMRGDERVQVARDAYSYLHLPMIAGIVLIALGVKKTIGDVDHALKVAPAVALFGGVALYYGAHVAFRLRSAGSLGAARLLAALACLPLILVATEIDAIASLAIAAALTASVIAYETVRYGESRRRIRTEHAGG